MLGIIPCSREFLRVPGESPRRALNGAQAAPVGNDRPAVTASETLEQRVDRLHEVASELAYDEIGHPEAWRNAVAADLNALVQWTDFLLSTREPDAMGIELTEVTLRVVFRVAKFEEIQRSRLSKKKPVRGAGKPQH